MTKTQQGYTLIELMIAGVLGIFLLGGAMQVFFSSSQTTSLQSAMADLQERSRFISMYLNNEFERAGWLEPVIAAAGASTPPTAVTFSGTSETAEDILPCNGGSTMCDRIRITYNGIRDCLGAQVNGGNIGVVTNTYFVQNGELRCEGNTAGVNDVILNNVVSFQLLYGLDDSDGQGLPYTSVNDNDDGLIDRYVEAFDFNTSGLETLRAIRFAILLESPENAFDENTASTFTLFNETPLTFNDRQMRLLVSGTSIVANGE